MLYKYAKRLHNGDQFTVKETRRTMQVVKVEVDESARTVRVMGTDGVWYGHKGID